jgi:predicted GIY-YIG superfamily endonuclease
VDFHVYILRCTDGSYYTGHTDDLERRVGEHQTGLIPGHTHMRGPVTLVYSAAFATREEALAAELQIKPWSRRKKEALIKGDWRGLSAAAKKDFAKRRGPLDTPPAAATRGERSAATRGERK